MYIELKNICIQDDLQAIYFLNTDKSMNSYLIHVNMCLSIPAVFLSRYTVMHDITMHIVALVNGYLY